MKTRSTAAIIHYLDDFLAIFATVDAVAAREYKDVFSEVCRILGLEIKVAKNVAGTSVEFLGIIIDTVRMEARLPEEKKERGLRLITALASHKSCTLLDLQLVTGLLNFLLDYSHFLVAFVLRL